MTISYKTIDTCCCCGGRNLHEYLDLGHQPLANAFHRGDKKQELFPLKVNACTCCFHSQLSIVVDSAVLYSDYPYVTGISKTFKEHCRRLAEDVSFRLLDYGQTVRALDIGCNDGTLLEEFRTLGFTVAGVDPARNLRSITEAKDIHVFVSPWNEGIAELMKQEFDVITSTNSFAHVDDNVEFLSACRIALADNGLLVIEVPYVSAMISRLEFDTIYHEHLSYFTVNSFQRLAERCRFTIVDVTEQDIHGGSVRFYLNKSVGAIHCHKVEELISREIKEGLCDLRTYEAFANKVALLRDKVKDTLTKLEGKTIGYGASAKGNVMLNYCGINLDYIVDDTPQKQGLLTPGRNISVMRREVLQAEIGPVNIVILSWNFADEIIGNIRRMRGPERNDRYITLNPYSVTGGD